MTLYNYWNKQDPFLIHTQHPFLHHQVEFYFKFFGIMKVFAIFFCKFHFLRFSVTTKYCVVRE